MKKEEFVIRLQSDIKPLLNNEVARLKEQGVMLSASSVASTILRHFLKDGGQLDLKVKTNKSTAKPILETGEQFFDTFSTSSFENSFPKISLSTKQKHVLEFYKRGVECDVLNNVLNETYGYNFSGKQANQVIAALKARLQKRGIEADIWIDNYQRQSVLENA